MYSLMLAFVKMAIHIIYDKQFAFSTVCVNMCVGESGSGEAVDNDGGTMPPEGKVASLLQTSGDAVQEECTPHSGKHQLVGADRTIQISNYTANQSQLVGSHSYHSVRSETPGTKYYITVGHEPDIAVTGDGNLENMVNICVNKVCIC